MLNIGLLQIDFLFGGSTRKYRQPKSLLESSDLGLLSISENMNKADRAKNSFRR